MTRQLRGSCLLSVALAVGCVEYGGPIRPLGEEAEPARESPGLDLGSDVSFEPPASAPAVEAAPAEEMAAPPLSRSPGESGSTETSTPVEAEPPPETPGEMPEPPLGVLPGTPPPELALLGSAERPELDPAVAERRTVADYLALAGNLTQGLARDGWDPSAGDGEVASFVADFSVAASGGTHSTLQAAISEAVAAGGDVRRFIALEPGTYREVVCVPSNAPPLTVYGLDADASQTLIAFDNYAGKPKASGSSANPCNPNLNATSFGTSGSATFAVLARDFSAKNLSIVNDTNEAEASGGLQAVALLLQGDRALFDNVRLLGNQNTLLAKTPAVDTVSRAYFKSCYVEGDADFVLGRGTLVLDGCTLHSLSSRVQNGSIFSVSTDARNPFGFLITHSSFSADASAQAASIRLGRAWDENNSDLVAYAAAVASGIYPNGQVLVRESTLGPHIDPVTPWRAANSSSRPFDPLAGDFPANRLYEFGNTPAQ